MILLKLSRLNYTNQSIIGDAEVMRAFTSNSACKLNHVPMVILADENDYTHHTPDKFNSCIQSPHIYDADT